MAGQPLSADMQTDIRAVIQAMTAGDSSAASGALAQLASDAGNSPGASYIQQLSGASSSSGATASDSVTALLQSLDSSNSSQPTLNLLA
jgi:hypothetical protein